MPSQPNETDVRKEGGTSYWDAPEVDGSIQGKTLSTLDLSALAFNHPEEHQDQQQPKDEEDDDQKERQQQNSNTSATTAVVAHGATETETNPKSIIITAEEPADENNNNKYTSSSPYWDAPKEQYLEGKTLSTLDMSLLEANHPGDSNPQQEETQQQQQQQQTIKKNDSGYWDAAPIDNSLRGKTLSTLSITAMNANHADGNDITGSYWEAPEEEKLKGKTLSTIDVATLATNSTSSCGDASSSTDDRSAPSYWDDAPIDESIKRKTLSKLDMTEMNKQHIDVNEASMSVSPYWDWNFKAARKTLSNLSLKSLLKGSGKDTVVLDDNFNVVPSKGSSKWVNSSNNNINNNNNNNNSPKNKEPVKSITNKVHKLRDSWRKSFHRLSTNTLDQLDESGKSTGSAHQLMGKRMFKSLNVLDVSGGSRSSQGSADGIMF